MKVVQVIALVFVVLVSNMSHAQIDWMTMDQALAAQKLEPKKIFMDVYTDWCGPCKLLDKKTFSNKKVIRYINQHYYAVKFNGEGTESVTYNNFTYTNPNYQPERKGRNAQHFFADALKITAYPSLVFFNETGGVIQALPGYKSPQDLEIFLKMIATDDFKALTTEKAWETYRNNFKGKF
ncbi:MAG: thioredoxin [Cryomorphaceae bacterium BACL21 MAG-121220-bin10]|jgi:thioredoxin-related protein|nr:MAG: thioredoxin [Cryomorphaceae bacterium BACL21 MAG-121220-bin10]|tara:strand:+ start:9124 stop:9663 length:540 start_codon:yes stop_codon:yes gene_type:complete